MSKGNRSIDYLVAQHLMGITPTASYGELLYMYEDKVKEVPRYSRDISAAWEVVDKLVGDYDFEFKSMMSNNMVLYWLVTISDYKSSYTTTEDSLEKAICIAALTYKGVEISDELL